MGEMMFDVMDRPRFVSPGSSRKLSSTEDAAHVAQRSG